MLAAAERAAAGIDVPVCIAVGDPGGNLVAFARMDGAPLLSAGIAQDKAYTVTAFNGVPRTSGTARSRTSRRCSTAS